MLQKSQILIEISKLTGLAVPDNKLDAINTANDIVDCLSTPKKSALEKGMPALEIFHGQQLPQNVTLINYRKRKWTDSVAALFVKKRTSLKT